MRLTVLGAGPAYSDRPDASGAATSSRTGRPRVLLDLGHGLVPADLRGAVAPRTSTAVVVSHLHPDHFIDLVPLRHYLRYYLDPPRRVRVLGPAELAARLDALHADPRSPPGRSTPRPIGEDVPPDRDRSRSRAARVAHTDDSYAIRVSPSGRRERRAGPRLLRRLRPGRRPATADRGRATRCCPRSRSGRARCPRACSISTARRSGASRPRAGSAGCS